MIEQNDRIRGRIPEIFKTLMEPHLEKVDEVISPGLTVLRWTSLNIEAFLQSVEGSLTELELLVERVSNTMEFQIEGVLQDIQNTVLCDLPDSEAWTVDEFFNRTQVSLKLDKLRVVLCMFVFLNVQKVCESAAVNLDMMTMKIERAAHEVVDLLLSSLDTDIVLDCSAVSATSTSATTVSIIVPKKADIADMDLKPGMHSYSFKLESMALEFSLL